MAMDDEGRVRELLTALNEGIGPTMNEVRETRIPPGHSCHTWKQAKMRICSEIFLHAPPTNMTTLGALLMCSL